MKAVGDRAPRLDLGEACSSRRTNKHRLGNVRFDFAFARGIADKASRPAQRPVELRLAGADDLADQPL
jgi:hypothetical protein